MTAPVIDCDIHPGVPDIKALLPYMSQYWQDSFTDRGLDGFDMMSYPLGAPVTCRPDWRVPGERPGSSLPNMQRDALDRFGIGIAICNPLTGGQVAVSETMGASICSAVNDWVREHWLDKDKRLRASIVVPPQSPTLAVEEIERVAGDKRFVQVLLPAACELMLGRSYYWPIYEAAQRHNMPVGIHAGSMYRYAPTATGWPSHYLQDYISNNHLFEGQLLSLVSNGVFARFPDLKFVFIESGVSWLPHFIWRAIKTWRGVRAEVPWVNQSPGDIIRNNIRVTTQPFDAPDQATVQRIVEQIDCEDMFLFASDYPHWQFDEDAIVPAGMPASLVQRMRTDNPLSTYPRLRETLP
ncbi:MAG: amidohydrolase [Proteobacteria bacterium]|nr:amidohydrolase [Pseudomonadota bacterium]